MSFNRHRRRLSRALAFALLVVTVAGFNACADSEDADPANSTPPSTNSAPASTASVDPTALASVKGDPYFSLDELGGQPPKAGVPLVVNAQSTPTINLRGWAADYVAKREAGGVIINIDGKTDVMANYGSSRPDVSANLKNPVYTNTGFTASIDTTKLEKGRHTLSMRVVTADKRGYYEHKQKYEIDVQ
ncbi:MAG TPA: hypothetical protein VGB73_14580 [Pyrinomonadaceae bacterium]